MIVVVLILLHLVLHSDAFHSMPLNNLKHFNSASRKNMKTLPKLSFHTKEITRLYRIAEEDREPEKLFEDNSPLEVLIKSFFQTYRRILRKFFPQQSGQRNPGLDTAQDELNSKIAYAYGLTFLISVWLWEVWIILNYWL